MITEQMIEKAAQSDAGFDGRTWMAMGRGERDRYRARAKASLEVVGPMLVAAERDACAQIAESLARHAEDAGFRLAKSRTGQDKAKAGKAMAQRLAIAIRSRAQSSDDEEEHGDV